MEEQTRVESRPLLCVCRGDNGKEAFCELDCKVPQLEVNSSDEVGEARLESLMEEEQSLVWWMIGQKKMHDFTFRETPVSGEATHEEAQRDREQLFLFK